jgi:hypothetical protein
MSKKVSTGVAPLLTAIAFAVLPAVAQATTPHWYKNGVILSQGTQLPVVLFGGPVKIEATSTNDGEFRCRVSGGGYVENPIGGGAGIGRIENFGFYRCEAPTWEEEAKRKFGTQGGAEVRTENLPVTGGAIGIEGWRMRLEGEPGSETDAIGVRWEGFPEHGQLGHESPAGMIRFTIAYTLPAEKGVFKEEIYEGELDPQIGEAAVENLNGLSATHPSSMHLAGFSSGTLHTEGLAFERPFFGSVKYLGYNVQEVLGVK